MKPKQKTILKGIAASRGGRFCAKVKVISSLDGIDKLNKGDVMVSSFLTPDFCSFMKKISQISGIITDEGCSTCHAAILARELKIPYIAATACATKKLKNGDAIFMDSENGIVYEI
jgi:pyruvate, water dikinase